MHKLNHRKVIGKCEYIGDACVSVKHFAAFEGRKLKYETYAAVIATLDSTSVTWQIRKRKYFFDIPGKAQIKLEMYGYRVEFKLRQTAPSENI